VSAAGRPPAVGVEDVEQGANLEVLEGGASEVAVAVDFVAVAAAYLRSFEVAAGDELGDYALGGAFGDADLLSDVAGAAVGVTGDAEQDVGMVAQEHPRGLFVGRSLHSDLFIAI
jgi:hypothetical protein